VTDGLAARSGTDAKTFFRGWASNIASGLFLVGLLYCFLARILDPSSDDAEGQINLDAASSNPINQIFWILLFSATLFGVSKRNLLEYGKRIWPLLAYLALSAASIVWADAPEIVFRRFSLQLLIVGSFWIQIAAIDNLERVRAIFLACVLMVLALNVVAVGLGTPTDLGYAGIYGQKNELGAAAAIGALICVCCLCAAGSHRVPAALGLLAALALLVASRSKTSLGFGIGVPAAVLGALAVSRYSLLSARVLVYAVALAAFACGFAMMEIFDVRLGDIFKVLFGDATFTGRTDIWNFAVDAYLRQPLLGHGYNGFWGIGEASIAQGSSGFESNIIEAHNGYIDILLETGAAGLAVMLVFITRSLGRALSLLEANWPAGMFVSSLLLFATLHNLMESSLVRRYSVIWIVFLVGALCTPPPRSSASTPRDGKFQR
jgi:exopolysaccharide production protein ExoQ